MSEHIPTFIAALQACEPYGFTCEEETKGGKPPDPYNPNRKFFIYIPSGQRIGVVHQAILKDLEQPKTKRALLSIFKALELLPPPIVDWMSTMEWGRGIHREVQAARDAHGIKCVAKAATQRGHDYVPSEDIQVAARSRADQRQMSGSGFTSKLKPQSN